MSDAVSGLFLEFSEAKLGEMTRLLAKCLERLTEEQVWRKAGAHENSVANLMLHLSGNMRQWMLHGIRGDADVRTRDEEFSVEGGMTKEELLKLFSKVVGEAREVIASLPAERLTERINPQNGEVSVLGAIYQVVGHVQQHVGQIILLTKQMTGGDLDLTMPRKR